MEGGIGDGDVRDPGERRACSGERVERRPVVERRDCGALLDVGTVRVSASSPLASWRRAGLTVCGMSPMSAGMKTAAAVP